MQKKQSKSLKRNNSKIQKMLESKKEKKERLNEENCQDSSWQENYLDSQIKDTIKNTGQDQKEIGDNGKEKGQESKEPQKQ